jgi:hypothetical protein
VTSEQSVNPDDRRAVLEHTRDRLLAELDSGGHAAGCECECGPVADGRVLATLSKELRATLAELDTLPKAKEASKSADLRARVASRWGSAS